MSPRTGRSPALSPRLSGVPTPASVRTLAPNSECEIRTAVQPSNGYLGYTSYSSVYEETESALGVAASSSTPDVEYRSGVSKARKPSPRILSACLKILGHLPDPENGVQQFRQFPTTFDGFPHAVARRILHSLYATFGRYLEKNRSPQDLDFVTRKLCANTALPFTQEEKDPERWMEQFLGENLRWESLGILFTFWDLYAPEDGSQRFAYHHKAKFSGRVLAVRESLKLCVEVCSEFSSGNTLLLYISQKYAVAESTYSGDASELFSFQVVPPVTNAQQVSQHGEPTPTPSLSLLSSGFMQSPTLRLTDRHSHPRFAAICSPGYITWTLSRPPSRGARPFLAAPMPLLPCHWTSVTMSLWTRS